MNRSSKSISSEVLAAYMAGNATAEESVQILEAVSDDAELREVLRISALVDADLKMGAPVSEILPAMCLAANCDDGAYCSLECEKRVLARRGIAFDEDKLLEVAVEKGWQEAEGTALYNIGRHLEGFGLCVRRKFGCVLEDIIVALDAGADVIAAVDGGELLGDMVEEFVEDQLIGEIPDHVVVILSYNPKERTITIFDPDSVNVEDVYTWEQFSGAWADSGNYLVTVGDIIK